MLLKWVHSMLSADCRLLIPDYLQGEGGFPYKTCIVRIIDNTHYIYFLIVLFIIIDSFPCFHGFHNFIHSTLSIKS